MSPQEFKDMLFTVTDKVHHLEAPKDAEDEYIIWQEMGGRSLHASNVRCETIQKFQVEVYTRKEFSELPEKIMTALEENEIAFQEQKPYFDSDTKKFRHIIECEAV